MIGGCRSILISSLYNAFLIFYLVLLIPCFCLFMCPLSVDGSEFGRYFWADRAVNPCHVGKKLLIAFRIVCLGGINSAWWSYFMNADLDLTAYAFYAMCLVWTISVSVFVFSQCQYPQSCLWFSSSLPY